MVSHIADMRKEYRLAGLNEADLAPDPFAQFAAWFAAAEDAGVPEPSAMTVATATKDGTPSARVVLLKGVDGRGFVFYTNYESQKGTELAENPQAALTFFWPGTERQVRVVGTVERVSREESQAYFDSRPIGSRVAAGLSPQSRPVASREELEAEFARQLEAHADGEVPLPDGWGGYRVTPSRVEFWQGRPSRMHDRLRYRRETPDGPWTVERLAP